MGVITPKAMPTYPHGFPDEVIDPFMNQTGRGVLGNVPASGTEIIQELGEEHQKTGKWIVYTSADSVFQIAAHEETVPLEELYAGCRVARGILITAAIRRRLRPTTRASMRSCSHTSTGAMRTGECTKTASSRTSAQQ
jgi:phosphopentomutase